MGYFRKKVKKKKPRRRSTRRRRRKRRLKLPRINFKLIGALLCAAFVVYYFTINPPSYRSIVSECDELYSIIKGALSERSGVLTTIQKTAEINISRGIKYKKYDIDLKLIAGVRLDKFWIGIGERIPKDYEIKKRYIRDKNKQPLFEVKAYYANVLICRVKLIHGAKSALPPSTVQSREPQRSSRSQTSTASRTKTTVSKKSAVAVKKTVSPTAAKPQPRKKWGGPKIAFVIDDVGYNRKYDSTLFSLPPEIAVSVLPRLPFSQHFSSEAHRRGFDVMLHLPLEAEDGKLDPGPGTIRTSMTREEIERALAANLATVPNAIGVNNHMGSKATAHTAVMNVILKEVKRRGLFFLDSYTSQNSVVKNIASKMRIPYLKRNVFIDNSNDPAYIKGQIRELIATAKEQGSAIGIGHYRRNTLKVLREMVAGIRNQGVEIVSIRELVNEAR